MTSYPCTGCGMRSCEGECYLTEREPVTYASFMEKCDRIVAEREVRQIEAETAEIRARTEAMKAKIARAA